MFKIYYSPYNFPYHSTDLHKDVQQSKRNAIVVSKNTKMNFSETCHTPATPATSAVLNSPEY